MNDDFRNGFNEGYNAGEEASDKYYNSYDESEESDEEAETEVEETENETEVEQESEYLYDGILKSNIFSGATFDFTLNELLDKYNELMTEEHGNTADIFKLNKTKDDILSSSEVDGDCTEYVIPYEVPGIDGTILAVHIFVYNPTEKVVKVSCVVDNNYAEQWLAVADGSDTDSAEYDNFTIYMFILDSVWLGAARDLDFDDASDMFAKVIQDGYIYEDGFACKNCNDMVNGEEFFFFEYVACTEDYL